MRPENDKAVVRLWCGWQQRVVAWTQSEECQPAIMGKHLELSYNQ